jgi:hypothetical protein
VISSIEKRTWEVTLEAVIERVGEISRMEDDRWLWGL